MTTREMLTFMKAQGYPLTLMATQSGVDYFKLYRHQRGKALTSEEKAQVWRFALCQPALESKVMSMAIREDKRRGVK